MRRKGRHRAPKRRFAVLYAALAVVVSVGTYAVDAHGGAAQAAVTGRSTSHVRPHATHWHPSVQSSAPAGRP